MKKIALVVGAAVGCAVSLVQAQDIRELAFQTAVPARVSPKIDGVLDDACWKDAPAHSDYYEYLVPNPRRVTNTKTDCMIVYDAKGVTVGIRNWEDQPEKLRQNVTKNFQAEMWTDDCGEIYIDPDASGIGYYKFTVNCLGKHDSDWRMDAANMDYNWVAVGIVSAAKIFKDRWEMELFVPWNAFHNRPAAKAGDIWTFNHSRFRFGPLGWGRGFSTTAPGASGVSANKFGYLYFSDGTKPDAKKVLALLEQRLNVLWGISIDGKVYVHDLKGTHESDLESEKKSLEQKFREQEASLSERIAAAKRNDLKANLDKLHVAFTNELAKYDGSFASVKQFQELVNKVGVMDYVLKTAALVDPKVQAAPLEMPLAGKYDLTPPKEYDGHNGWYRSNRIKNAYVTPSLEWAPQQLGNAPHPLFLSSYGGSFREAVELEQRFEYDDPLFHPGGFGATGIYEDPISHNTFLDKQAQIETLLAKNPNVIVFNGYWFNSVPAHYRYEMLRRVRDEGVGLALFGGNVDSAILKQCARDKELEKTFAASAIQGRPELYQFGKGRIAQVGGWSNPGWWSLKWKGNFETRNAFMGNVIRWAAGGNPAACVDFAPAASKDALAPDAAFLACRVRTRGSDVNAVRLRLRTAENVVVSDERRALNGDESVVSVDLKGVAAGEYFLDVLPYAKGLFGGERYDFSTVHRFAKASRVGMVTIDGTNTTIVAEGTGPTWRIAWDKGIDADVVVKYEVADHPYGQVRIRGEVKANRGWKSVNVQLPKRDFPTLAAIATVKVVADGDEIAAARKLVFFPNHRFPDYTMIMWEGLWQDGVAELFAPQLIDVMGYENHLGESGNLSAIFNGRAVPHITRVCLGGSKQGTVWGNAPQLPAKTQEEKDYNKKIMADYNVYRPEVREYFEKAFTPRVKKCAPYGVCVYNLGDECHYSSDIGFGDEQDEGYYRDFIAKRYGSVARFNQAHGTNIKDWKEVVHKTTSDAKKEGDWTSWMDQTAYAAKMYSDTFQLARSVIKKYDPKGRVGAEGSPSGNLEETVKNLEFWGPYGDVYLDEVLKSIAPDRVRGMWWGGYVQDPRDGFPGLQWNHLLTGRANGDEWFSAIIGSTAGSHGGDLTLAPYVEKLLPHHAQLKKGLASYMIRTPLRKDGFAIYYSWPSGCASTLSDDYASPAAGGRDLIHFCYRQGLEVSFVTPSTLKALDDKKLVFLPGVCSLSDKEVAALKAFQKRGGQIWADAEPGVLDEFLAKRAEAPLKGLWQKYARGGGDAEYAKAVAGIGVKQREFVKGIPLDTLVLRVRETPEQKVVGFACLAKSCGSKVTVELGSKGYVYECDQGYVGECDKVEIASLERPFKLYTQFAVKQSVPTFVLSPSTVGRDLRARRTGNDLQIAPGDFVEFSTKPLRKDGVYRLSVKGPDGKVILNRDQIVIVDGKSDKVSFQFPYTDKGTYTVTLRDIATGLETVRTIQVAE